MTYLLAEPPGAAPEVEALLDRAFGAARLAKTAERLREGRLPAAGLSLVATDGRRLVGTIRFWYVGIGGGPDRSGRGIRAGTPALLLGPVAVESACQGAGVGRALIRSGLAAAAGLGHRAVILVGDAPYYRRLGFTAQPTRSMTLPGPVDRNRFLAIELVPGALDGAAGLVHPTGLLDPRQRYRSAA